jgi:hypothetical protein
MNPRRPKALTVVAWLFVIGGVCVCIEILIGLLRQHLSLNLGVIGIFIGMGLLRLSRGWRTMALVSLWIALLGTPLVAMMALSGMGALSFTVFGIKVAQMSIGPFLIYAFGFFVLTVWQYRVLTRSDVRALFYPRWESRRMG